MRRIRRSTPHSTERESVPRRRRSGTDVLGAADVQRVDEVIQSDVQQNKVFYSQLYRAISLNIVTTSLQTLEGHRIHPLAVLVRRQRPGQRRRAQGESIATRIRRH